MQQIQTHVLGAWDSVVGCHDGHFASSWEVDCVHCGGITHAVHGREQAQI
tara:strand:+ start:962 stop:1111 length:150 start_codon:yes stop_codon:yes gene_type:complete